MLKGKLKLEGATLDVRPKLTVSSHHQSTQPKNTSEKLQKFKTDDHDSDQFLNRQLGILSGQDTKGSAEDWGAGVGGYHSRPVEETHVECTESAACYMTEIQDQRRGVYPVELPDFGGWYNVCSKLLFHV